MGADLKESSGAGSEGLKEGLEVVELRQKVHTLEEEAEKMKESSELYRTKLEKSKEEAQNLRTQVEELKTCTSVDDSMFEDDEKERIKMEMEELKKEKEMIKQDLDVA